MDARLPVKPQRGKSYRSLKSSSPIMLKLRAFNIWKGRSSHLHPVNRKKHPLSYHGKEEGSFMHPLHHCCLLKLSSKSWPLWLTRENSPPSLLRYLSGYYANNGWHSYPGTPSQRALIFAIFSCMIRARTRSCSARKRRSRHVRHFARARHNSIIGSKKRFTLRDPNWSFAHRILGGNHFPDVFSSLLERLRWIQVITLHFLVRMQCHVGNVFPSS